MPEKFSASRAGRLMICPGSANLSLSIPGWTPPVVDEEAGAKGKGNRLHEMLAEISAYPAKDILNLAACLNYMADIRSTRRFKVAIEETRKAMWLDSQPETTVDLVLWVQDELHIFDWKTGKIPVYADMNSQLMYYGVTWADVAPKAHGINFHIVQPWATDPSTGFNGISHWFCDTDTLLEFQEKAIEAEKKILNNSTQLQVSDHCMFCPAFPHSRSDKGRPLCPAAMKQLYPLAVDESEILND